MNEELEKLIEEMNHPYKDHPAVRPGTTFGLWEIYSVELYRYCYDVVCEVGLKGEGADFCIPGDFLDELFREFNIPVDTSNYYPEKVVYNK